MMATLYSKAMSHLLRCPVTENGESVELAIHTVRNELIKLFHAFVLFLYPQKISKNRWFSDVLRITERD